VCTNQWVPSMQLVLHACKKWLPKSHILVFNCHVASEIVAFLLLPLCLALPSPWPQPHVNLHMCKIASCCKIDHICAFVYVHAWQFMPISDLPPLNSENIFCENNEDDMLKIIIIIIGYTLNNFTSHITMDHGKNQ
jgi:hypothetical protein